MLNLEGGRSSFWILLFLLIPHSLAQSDATTSIQDDPDWNLIRYCARCHLYYCGWDDVNSLLEANRYNQLFCRSEFSATVNSYLSSRISADCTPKPVTGDISSVISLYSKYCQTALNPATVIATSEAPSSTTPAAPEPSSSTNPAAPKASTTIASYTGSPVTSTTTDYSAATSTSNSGQSSGAVVTVTALPSTVVVTKHATSSTQNAQSTSPNSAGNGPSSKIDGGAIGGIVVGIFGVLGTFLGIYLAWRRHKKQGTRGDNEAGGTAAKRSEPLTGPGDIDLSGLHTRNQGERILVY